VSDLALATTASKLPPWTPVGGEADLSQGIRHAAFNETGGSASWAARATPPRQLQPALAYLTAIFWVWADTTSGFSEIYGVLYSGGVRNVIITSGVVSP
jgi:hypothetical protein